MIQFLGVDFSARQVSVVCLGRDLRLTAEVSTPVANVRGGEPEGVTTVPATEWIRAGAYALQEAYLALPVASRKPWGIGLSSVAGWVPLDPEFEPLCDVRLLPAPGIGADLSRWLGENPRLVKRVTAILSAKDYFRFALSRTLAADATTASRQGLLRGDKLEWSPEELDQHGIPGEWLPPVFESHVPTGRISEEGMRRTGLPGGLWLVAGALSLSSAMAACGDLRGEVLWAPAGRGVIAYGFAEPLSPTDPRVRCLTEAGFSLGHSAVAGCRVLEKRPGESDETEKLLGETKRRLERAGFRVADVVRDPGRPEVGAAVLAGIGSGLLKSWDWYYDQVP